MDVFLTISEEDHAHLPWWNNLPCVTGVFGDDLCSHPQQKKGDCWTYLHILQHPYVFFTLDCNGTYCLFIYILKYLCISMIVVWFGYHLFLVSFENKKKNNKNEQTRVIRTKSVKYMPFLLSFANFANGIVWTTYALLKWDPFIVVIIIFMRFHIEKRKGWWELEKTN